MDCKNLNYNFISQEDFLCYLDWLSRFKNPVFKNLRVAQKVLTRNLIEPKLNMKKLDEMDYLTKMLLTREIWVNSLGNIFNSVNVEQNAVGEFLSFEDTKTYNMDSLYDYLTDVKTDYKNLAEISLPMDILVKYFEQQKIDKPFLNRLVYIKNSLKTDNNEQLFNKKSEFSSIRLLLLVEGVTEEILLPVFADKYGFNFNQCGIKLKAAGGKTQILKYYSEIYRLVKIPVFILLDSDAIDVLPQLNSVLRKNDQIYIIEGGEFEDIVKPELMLKTINDEFKFEAQIAISDLITNNKPKTKLLYELFRDKGLGEFHKAKFAQMLLKHVVAKDDISDDLMAIFESIKSLVEASVYSS